ncbi:MAG TPA: helix-turn-helix transcriptional regulator [Xanthobacteraceae bacterium]|nr:helix-turn-helix transcriptional regulator [Xanthobacteraceae bacterium]
MAAIAAARRREPATQDAAVQPASVRVAICIADPVLRSRTARALEGAAAITVVGVAESAEAMHTIDPDRIDAVLTDAPGDRLNWVAAPDETHGAEVTLTARERDVLAALAAGASNKTIARRLGISFHTAKFHVAAILTKLDADSRTEAVAKAAHLGLVML